MSSDEDEYFNYRCTRKCLDALDIFFTWGEKHKSIVTNKYPDLKEKVVPGEILMIHGKFYY